MKISREKLKQLQLLPLESKIEMTLDTIYNFKKKCKELGLMIYEAHSGGIDSTVLGDLVRTIDKKIPFVFSNTGLEFPEIIEFINTLENVIIIRPVKSFNRVIKENGYPVFSKKVSMGLDRYRNTKDEAQKILRLHGGINPTSGKIQERTIPIKFHYMINAPFKCSEACCYFLKKKPFKDFNKKYNAVPIIGTMASDSDLRRVQYMKTGCNSFDTKFPKSTPLGFWTKENILEYIEKYNIKYSPIYDMGYSNTGCIFCLFGIHKETGKNRFQLLKKTHPKKWVYCMDKLGIREVMKFINLPIE